MFLTFIRFNSYFIQVHPTANGKYTCSITWENGVMIESEEVPLTVFRSIKADPNKIIYDRNKKGKVFTIFVKAQILFQKPIIHNWIL